MLKRLSIFIFCAILILSTSLQTVSAYMQIYPVYVEAFEYETLDDMSQELNDYGLEAFCKIAGDYGDLGKEKEKHRKFDLYLNFPKQTFIPYFNGKEAKRTKNIIFYMPTGITTNSTIRRSGCVFIYNIELTSTEGFTVLAEIKVNHLPKEDWDNVYNTCLDKVANFSSEYSKIHSVNLGGEEYQSDFGDICVYEAYTRANSDGINGSKYYIFGMTDRKTYITVQFLDNPLYENSELRENTGYTVPQEFLGNIDWLSKLTFKKHEFNDTKPIFKTITDTILDKVYLEVDNISTYDQYNISVKDKDPGDLEYKKISDALNIKGIVWFGVYNVTADKEGKKILEEPQWTVFNTKSDRDTYAFKLTDDGELQEIDFISYDDFTIIDIDEPAIYAFVDSNELYKSGYLKSVSENSDKTEVYIIIISVLVTIIFAGAVVVVLLLRKRNFKKEN